MSDLHEPKMCMREGCSEEATRWYEERGYPDETFYVCTEHPEVAAAEESDARILNSEGKLVELAVYQCAEDCEVCA